MKPEAQRIAIAEACGWEIEPDLTGVKPPGCGIFTYRGYHSIWSLLPDYLGDLNAMREAEKMLKSEDQNFEYDQFVWKNYGCRAAAAQRAEAFLRAIGKWKDEAIKP